MLFLALVAVVFAAMMKDNDMIVNMDMINAINNGNYGWTAGVNAIFVGKTYNDVKGMLGWLGRLGETKKRRKSKKRRNKVDLSIPDSFDTYIQWPNCHHPIRNQGNCGSCWAFSGAEVLSDRFCIAGHDEIFSPQWLVSCEYDQYGCDGGYLSPEWVYLQHTGIVTEECFPYESAGGIEPDCITRCKDRSPLKMYTVSSFTHYGSVSEAQADMLKAGSFQVGFNVYSDFFNYQGGVYTHLSGTLAGGHAVKVQGWGIDSLTQQPYWNVANSWGPDWGVDGYFWILRGSNECGIEDQMYGGVPSL